MRLEDLGLSIEVIDQEAKATGAGIVPTLVIVILLVATSLSIEKELCTFVEKRARPTRWVVVRFWVLNLM